MNSESFHLSPSHCGLHLLVGGLRRAVNNVNKMQEEEYLFLQLFSVFMLLLLLLLLRSTQRQSCQTNLMFCNWNHSGTRTAPRPC